MTSEPMNNDVLLSFDKRSEFRQLFTEFAATFPFTADGQSHIKDYAEARRVARHNFDVISEKSERGEDITDDVLVKFLPYNSSDANRAKGAWTHLAPTVKGDIRKWFERAGWTQPEDWPYVANAIYDFVLRCVTRPSELEAAIADFQATSYDKGFQAGMLSPILNALNPDAFFLVNRKPVQVLTYLTGKDYSQNLSNYPEVNADLRRVVSELEDELVLEETPDLTTADLFDMFCHWLVAVKKHSLTEPQYWKVAPGENAWQWEDCLEGEFIAIGWDDLGDISGLSRSEFNTRRDGLVEAISKWNKQGVDQVWKFANWIREGDRIVANRGTTEALGIGTVSGPYYFVPDTRHGHRLPVEWEDTTVRQIDEGGWRKTLVKLDKAKFERISAEPGLADPFSDIFDSWEEADWAFDFARQGLEYLGITNAENHMISITFPTKERGRLLRINYGSWAVLDFRGRNSRNGKGIDLALLEERTERLGPYDDVIRWGPFSGRGDYEVIRVYEFPWDMILGMDESLGAVFEDTFIEIVRRFSNWKASNVRKYHRQNVFEAIFDLDKRHKLFTAGIVLYDYSQNDEPVAESLINYEIAEDAAFSLDAFELMAGLHADPTKEYYQDNKDAFVSLVEKPFQEFMGQVAANLPPAVTELMETDKGIYSRILKNDYGKGGAWDTYWGAFYPKGGKRTKDAQLILWINHKKIVFGFYIGEYSSGQRKRFQRNCQDNRATLKVLLDDSNSDRALIFGGVDNQTVSVDGKIISTVTYTWGDFLQDPSQFNNDISIVLTKDEVLGLSAEQLIAQITSTFSRLFPLVLLACEDNPLPFITRYLGLEPEPELNEVYPLAQVAEETGFDQEELARWVRAIERKKQAILFGPPGTGKTYIAERLAKHLVGTGDRDGIVELVQFHPAYAYEDFMQGIRPESDGEHLTYPTKPGRFLNFIAEAKQRKGTSVLIIDEINRANLARVFGELMYLLEYRNKEIPLAGGGTLHIPEQVRIIGTMNTADRSIALVDHALRRRFAFLYLRPDLKLLRHFHNRQNTGFDLDGLEETLRDLNKAIADSHYELGITYFLRIDLVDQIEDIWCMEIEPYLEEYFFDQPEKTASFRWKKIEGKVLGT